MTQRARWWGKQQDKAIGFHESVISAVCTVENFSWELTDIRYKFAKLGIIIIRLFEQIRPRPLLKRPDFRTSNNVSV